MEIKGVIFDMDGVIIDNRDVHEISFNMWCDRNGVERVESLMEKYSGKGNRDIFEDVLGRSMTLAEVDRCSQEKEAIYRELFAQQMEPLAGLVDFLKELKSAGIMVAVGSSAIIENIDFVLDGCGIRDYFDVISHSGIVARAKPAPDIFLKAAELMGLLPDDCFVFEDAFSGIEAARLAGMGVGVLATTFPRGAHSDYDLLIDDFRGIDLGILRSL